MKNCRLFFLSLAIALFAANNAYARAEKTCSGKNETLECLKENFQDVYENQYFKFLLIISKAEVAALDCNSAEKTATYLGIIPKIGKNLEVEDGFKDILETKFIKGKPVCLLDALLLSDDNVKEIVLGKYLAKPRFIKKEEVDAVLSKYMDQEKYKEMLKRYSSK